MKFHDVLKSSSKTLGDAGVIDPHIEAEMIILHAAGVDRIAAYRDDIDIDGAVLQRIRSLITRRAKGEPVQYIIGEVNFLGLRIQVGPEVLIPRPETELLAEAAMRELAGILRSGVTDDPAGIRVLDLCCGSGCIALAMAREFPAASVFGSDVSAGAVSCSRSNAELSGMKNVTFLQGSLFEPFRGQPPFHLIVSNPPYIRTADIRGLQREIREWEPVGALDGGPDGLDFYREIFVVAGRHLEENGALLAEIGFDQASPVMRIAARAGFSDTSLLNDFAGIQRIIRVRKTRE